MIERIFSTLPTFRQLDFKPGLNILVAERHEAATARDTRNGTGKTSVIELLHFLVQDRKVAKDDFHKEGLVGHQYGADFQDFDSAMRIERRSGRDKEKDVAQIDGNVIDSRELRMQLAKRWFDLDAEILDQAYSPKFGALLSFFLRKERNGGFAAPTQNASMQQGWDSQVCLAYLLGFDWQLVQGLQGLKDKKKATDSVYAAIKDGFLSDTPLDLNKMQSRLDFLEAEVEKKRVEIKNARVLDGYESLEEAANKLTIQIRDRNEANLSDLDLRESIAAAQQEVAESNIDDIQTVYEQIGIYFGDQVIERLDRVVEFHRQVAENRKNQLEAEDRRAANRVQERRREIAPLEKQLNEKLELLNSGVAIDRLGRLQTEMNNLEAEMVDLRQQLPRLRDVHETRDRLKREISEQVDLIGQDVQEREEARKFAVNSFAEISRHLYDEPGSLIIGKSKGSAGLQIETDIVGKKSGGKSHMQVFCFDWVLVESALRLNRFPGFLFHDSHIFDGVDGRQIGLALDIAQKKCDELGVQYIVAMNSDDLDKIQTEERETGEAIFDPEPFVMSTRLNDDENGGLFGLRF